MKLSHLILAAAAILASCSTQPKEEDFTAYVNPMIGTGGHGHVFVGANVPFGLVQVGPTSIPQQWDWCSGYHDTDSTVIGFSHTHLSGTGIGDLFDVTVLPVTGDAPAKRDKGEWALRSTQVCKPGFYKVELQNSGIKVELTATQRVGMHRYTFPETQDAKILFDLENGGCWDRVTDAGFQVQKDPEGHVKAFGGYRYSSGWARDQKIYFWAEFSRPALQVTELPCYAYFDMSHMADGEQLLLKVALSPESIDGARANMAAELPGWDFDATVNAAREAWNAELGKVRVDAPSADTRTVFYTALYHTMIAPSVFSDAGTPENYTTWSLWDTYRAANPLATILHPEKIDAFTRTFYNIYKEQGDLPVWHLMGNETDCMVGNPGTVSFADWIVKGFDGGIPADELIRAMVDTDLRSDRGLDLRRRYGFIPADLYREAVSTDMEYAIADAALANAAAYLGYPEVEAEYREKSHSYRNYWDAETRFLRGRKTDGSFTEPFNPFAPEQGNHDYTEGNAWQYRFLVPQDIEGLQELFGGREQLLEALDHLFDAPSELEGEAPPDITGLIGQYAHGNEPSHHIIYLYSMLGAPDKAARLLRHVYDKLYFNAPDGLSGNEDVGQMSAWYVLSAMGFYQVEPAVPRYWFGLPLMRRMTVAVPGGAFEISAHGPHDGFIQLIKLNGKPYEKPYIEYKDIISGGKLEYFLGKTSLQTSAIQ